MSSILAIIFSFLILNAGLSVRASIIPNLNTTIQDSQQAKIYLSEESGKLKIQGKYLGTVSENLNYKLTIYKTGKGGTSNNAQSGKFKKEPNQAEVILSTSSFNINSGDEFKITLEIYQDSKIVSHEVLIYTAS